MCITTPLLKYNAIKVFIFILFEFWCLEESLYSLWLRKLFCSIFVFFYVFTKEGEGLPISFWKLGRKTALFVGEGGSFGSFNQLAVDLRKNDFCLKFEWWVGGMYWLPVAAITRNNEKMMYMKEVEPTLCWRNLKGQYLFLSCKLLGQCMCYSEEVCCWW